MMAFQISPSPPYFRTKRFVKRLKLLIQNNFSLSFSAIQNGGEQGKALLDWVTLRV